MDIVSIPKKEIGKIVFWVVLSLCLPVLLLGCNSRADRYPYDLADEWCCNELPFTLSYSIDEKGALVQSELLEWDGQTVAVDLAFSINTYCVYPENSYHHDDRLFSGTWEYRDGDLVLTLVEDFTFDMKYAELTFRPTT